MAHDETELTPEDMQKRVARYADLVPYKDTMNAAHGIAPEAMQLMSSDKVFPVMSPEGWAGRSKIAPIKGAPGLTVTIAECPPGDSSGLHKHTDTVENFFCVEGEIEILWGSKGENSITLGPLDFVSVPAGVYREFRNNGTEMGRLFVAIQTPPDEKKDTVIHAAAAGEEVERRFGRETRDAMADIGIKFGE
ncbi:MAG: cupin domain-containing protein [Rhodospirillaceae bacterium]|jgi:quercetin dioxygenase-like cupin family protein|nr:cupin domain-containing protein [Rhodospirillaceae bacterium]MBT3929640.1 cupin domain-containing protein [Rhodospirillaceae bacterium]MBT5357758.1 cupin domain-containing protein [Rhodospirillaceae bacterium]